MPENITVIAIAAQTIDGFIARDHNESINWSSKEDKRAFARATKEAGVVVMGRNTFETLGQRPLKNRLNIVLTSQPNLYREIEGLEFRRASPVEIVRETAQRGFNRLFVIGGARVFTDFLKAKLIDEMWLTIEPLIFGQGIAIFDQTVYGVRGQLLSVDQLNPNSIQLKYKLSYGS